MSSRHILHITPNLPLLVGGVERLNWYMAARLSRGEQAIRSDHDAR